jgi:hypothetical protein
VRCGAKKAAVAVGHTILRIVFHVLNEQEAYRESVIIARDERRRAQTQRRAVEQLTTLGYTVTITPMVPAA